MPGQFVCSFLRSSRVQDAALYRTALSHSCPTHMQGLAGARAAAADAAGWPSQTIMRGCACKLGRQPPKLGRGELLRGALHMGGQQVVHLAQAACGLGHCSQGCVQDPCISTTCRQNNIACSWHCRESWVIAAMLASNVPVVNAACWQGWGIWQLSLRGRSSHCS